MVSFTVSEPLKIENDIRDFDVEEEEDPLEEFNKIR